MITVQKLKKKYGIIEALSDVSFTLPKSKIIILAGADGAGKSTLIRIILGLVKQDEGKVFLKDKLLTKDNSSLTDICGYMPERFSLYPDLTVEENLNFFADIYSIPLKKREFMKEELLRKTGMSEFTKRRAGALSGGMKQKLALSTILLSSPELILLDEPTTGVDPLSRIEFFKIIENLRDDGKTIIISTPYLDEAEKGDYIIFLNKGKIITQDYIQSIRENFPMKLYRILTVGNVFNTLNRLNRIPGLRDSIYIKGKYIKYLKHEDRIMPKVLESEEMKEEKPSLEDIYLYYERTYNV
jgi:ABC-2 type transport system ATP-binding protein